MWFLARIMSWHSASGREVFSRIRENIIYTRPATAMKHPSALRPHAPEPTEDEIQQAAYMLWDEEGRPNGRDIAHWHAAEKKLRHRHDHDVRDTRRRNHEDEAES